MVHKSELWQMLPHHQQPESLPDHWKDATLEAKLYPGQVIPQLVINGDPMPHAYMPPDCSKWPFRAGAGGNSIWEHLPRIAELASQAAVIVEIGIASMTGSTHAFYLGIQASEAAPGRKFHIGIDLGESVSGPWVPQNPWWQYISGSSQDPATVEKVRQALTMTVDGEGAVTLPIDILYIDTVHEYEFLKAELANWLPLIGPNTLCLFHDTHRGGSYHPMTDAILEMANENCHGLDEKTGDEINEYGPLFHTHQYHQLSTTCEGLGALIPVGGWPK